MGVEGGGGVGENDCISGMGWGYRHGVEAD